MCDPRHRCCHPFHFQWKIALPAMISLVFVVLCYSMYGYHTVAVVALLAKTIDGPDGEAQETQA